MKKGKALAVLFCLLALSLIVDLQHAAAFSGAVGVRLVVRGTDNGVYTKGWSGSWSVWSSLPGSTLSAPVLCPDFSHVGGVQLVVRGSDNRIYRNSETGIGTSWAGWDAVPGGATNDQPACVVSGSKLHVVVRGTNNGLYYNSISLNACPCSWGAWMDLNGKTNSPPVLVPEWGIDAFDLFVHGTDDGIYHRRWFGSWGGAWDNPGGRTYDKPAGIGMHVEGPLGSGLYNDFLILIVRGVDNGVYENRFTITCNMVGCIAGWHGWSSLSGATLSTPAPTIGSCYGDCVGSDSRAELVVRGTDNRIYHKSFSGSAIPSGGGWATSWDSAGGLTTQAPAAAYDYVGYLHVVVAGTDNALYENKWGTFSGPWAGWVSLGGATSSAPSLSTDLHA